METLSALTEELKLIAYVGSGEHDPTPIWCSAYGWSWQKCSFATLYRHRPQHSRFVIVQDRDGDYLVFDLFKVQLNDDFWTFTIPHKAVEVYPTLDAALMAAKLQLA